MEEKEGGGAAREVFVDVLKRRPARARALPDAAGAKPGGDDTTPKIIQLKASEIKSSRLSLYIMYYNIKYFAKDFVTY